MRTVAVVLVGLLGIGVGAVATWIVTEPRRQPADEAPTALRDREVRVWTCSMHPQIRLPKPGHGPICGMQLVPAGGDAGAGGAVALGSDARQIASIEVAQVARRMLEHELRAVGRIELSEPRVAHLSGPFYIAKQCAP